MQASPPKVKAVNVVFTQMQIAESAIGQNSLQREQKPNTKLPAKGTDVN